MHNIPVEEGTNTIFFIQVQDLPANCKPTYPRVVVADRPNNSNPIRVRVTIGGDQINYPDEVSTKTSDLATVKLLLNSTLSTENAKWMTIDIKDFYLNTPMTRYEYMCVPLGLFPQAIIDHYNLSTLTHNDFVYIEIRKGMYGLPQAGRLANNELVIHLAQHGYIQSEHTPGLFTHNTRPISFCLVVDDFGVKYVGDEHAEHLITTLQTKYTITIDCGGTKCVGLTIDWDYLNKTVDISILYAILHSPNTTTYQSPQANQATTFPTCVDQTTIRRQTTNDPNSGHQHPANTH